MSYLGTTLRVNAAVLEANKTGAEPKDPARGEVPGLPKQYAGLDPSKVTIDSLIENGTCICGSPDTAIGQLERIQKEARLDKFLAMMQLWSIPHEKTMHAIDRFGKHVIPHFQKREAPRDGAHAANPAWASRRAYAQF